ncbi:ankyrin repeat, SAM and basic leucine zipper domain-containing protein 1-like [Plutella xylostella]|uniref:ankyrin repeat, SAM and basic leucine zipper domain-containing protein 1-like n=1 Tax=Plutella xylostella TaxID=51655 RepID=UPI0020321A81|nr:ankyrin repeat, SAM and basic leucine zipper domain-containing protein 1-like [Plutella xylostella]
MKLLTLFSNITNLNIIKDEFGPYREYFSYVPIIKLVFPLFISLILLSILKLLRRKSSNSILGKRKIQEIAFLKDIVLEVHYAACYCGSDSALIRRCKALLELYPAACNIPMYEHQYTPFLRACWNGCAELIAYMIRIGANIEVRTDAGEGGVYLATYSAVRNKTNDFSAIKILISAGLDVNQARHDGLRPLDLAALKGHSRLVRFLLAHGAAPTDQQDISMIIGKM